MFKISNNLPEVFLKSPDELAQSVRQRGGGALQDWGISHIPWHLPAPPKRWWHSW